MTEAEKNEAQPMAWADVPTSLAARAQREGFAVYDCGTLGDAETKREVHLYCDQRCTRCHHEPCPCCPTPWCDHGDCIRDDTLCMDRGCAYEAVPRFFTPDGAEWDGNV